MMKGFEINTNAFKETLINFLVPLICAVLSIAVGFLVLYPSYSSLPELKSNLEKSVQMENQLSTKVDTLNRLLDFKKVMDEDAAFISNALSSNAMVPELLTQINQIAVDSGLAVSSLTYSFGSIEDKTTYSNVEVNLGVEGAYGQLVTFLSNLENSARLINVNTFRYGIIISKDKSSHLSLTFILSSPYLQVDSNAQTDAPINFDITSKEFIGLINKVKQLKLYKVSVNQDVVKEAVETSASSTKPKP